MGSHDNCNSNRVYKTVNVNYTYSQFAKILGKSETKLSDLTKTSEIKKAKTTYNNNKDYTYCVGYSTGTYTCPGHRDASKSRTIEYAPTYISGDLMEHQQVNCIRNALSVESSARVNNALYSLVDKYTKGPYLKGDYVDHDLPKSMGENINNINNIIKNTTKVAKKLNGKKGDYRWNSAYRVTNSYAATIETGEICSPDDISVLLNLISVDYIDCICYSDCTMHGSSYIRYCSCNIACGCKYG